MKNYNFTDSNQEEYSVQVSNISYLKAIENNTKTEIGLVCGKILITAVNFDNLVKHISWDK